MKTTAIVQARLSSSRLPDKVLKPLAGKPVIEHIIERLQTCSELDEVAVAIPEDEADSDLDKELGRIGVPVVHGPGADVLKRYVVAAYEREADRIVRVTGDNPLTWPEGIDQQVRHLEENEDLDYVKMSGLPLGTMVETFTKETLDKLDYLADTNLYREHVTYYIREQDGPFQTADLSAPEHLNHPDLRLTLDTEQDYELLQNVYDKFYREGEIIQLEQVVDWLLDDEDARSINHDVVQVPA